MDVKTKPQAGGPPNREFMLGLGYLNKGVYTRKKVDRGSLSQNLNLY